MLLVTKRFTISSSVVVPDFMDTQAIDKIRHLENFQVSSSCLCDGTPCSPGSSKQCGDWGRGRQGAAPRPVREELPAKPNLGE